jgi:predicted Zn-ribbon and HTH transcriptional regulator
MPDKELKIDEPAEEQTLEQEAIAAFEQELAEDAKKEEAAAARAAKVESGKQYITKETPVDKFNVIRTRIELTPAVCDKCGFDVAARNGLGRYEDMSEAMQAQVAAAIKEHKDLVHTIATDLVVSEDEVPTEWLGSHKKF